MNCKKSFIVFLVFTDLRLLAFVRRMNAAVYIQRREGKVSCSCFLPSRQASHLLFFFFFCRKRSCFFSAFTFRCEPVELQHEQLLFFFFI